MSFRQSVKCGFALLVAVSSTLTGNAGSVADTPHVTSAVKDTSGSKLRRSGEVPGNRPGGGDSSVGVAAIGPIPGRIFHEDKDGFLVVDTSQTRVTMETATKDVITTTENGESRVRSVTRAAPLHTTTNSSVVINPAEVRFLWSNGKELSAKEIQAKLVKGAAVLVCSTTELPSPWEHVLNKRAIVIVQRPKPLVLLSGE